MPSVPFNYSSFVGGLNTRDSYDLLTDDQSRDLVNVQGTTSGAIVKRNGLQTFATPASAPTSLFACEATASPFLIAAVGTTLVKISSGGTVTSIKTGLTSGKRWEFLTAPAVSGQGPLFGMNGTDTPQQWTGSGSTADWTNTSGATAVPNGKYCVLSQNQVFVAGVAATPSRLYWSAIGDPTNWDPASLLGAGFEDFDPQDGEAISAIGIVGPYVLVCKPRKLWLLIDPASATVRRLSNSVGCVAHRSIASGPSGTYFLAEDRGVYLTNGSKLEPISDIIQPTVDSVQPGLRSQAAGACFNAHYYLSVPVAGAANDTVLDWDETLGSWWRHSFGSNQFAIWHVANVAQLYSAKSTAAFVDLAFAPGVLTDNGSAFTWVWRGPWQSPSFYRRRLFPTTYFRKRLRQIRVRGTGHVDFSVAHDFAGAESLWASNIFAGASTNTWGGTGTWGGVGIWGDVGSNEMYIGFSLGVADAHSVVFSGSSSDPGQVTSYTLYISDRRDRQVG